VIQGARRRLGRRGIPLLLLGAGKIGWGVGFVAAPSTDPRALAGVTAVMPLGAWACLWVGAGLVAIAAAFLPVGRDRWGYVAAVIPPGAWALGHFYAALEFQYLRALFVGLWYLLSHALVILWAASVAEYALPRVKYRSRRAPPLYLFGVGGMVWAIGYVAAPAASTRGLAPLLHGGLTMRVWATAWFFAGLVTITCLILPQGPDRWGFVAAAALPVVWAASYAWEWVTDGYGRGFFVALWFLTTQAGMALWAASVPEYELPHFDDEGRPV
jgi:hypothetical protein